MLIEAAPGWLMRSVFAIANRWPWLGKKVNKFAIDGTVNVCRHRPHPWSTVHDYISGDH
jgi:prostaglandin-endoperoxide synthase 2